MRTKLLLFLLLCSFLSQAQTIEVFGLQSGVWEADTVFVTGDVAVQDSLDIAPGTTVLFKGFYSIAVEHGAFLKAHGTETDSITFTVADTTGFHVFNFGRGGWNGIRINESSASFDYCRFQYGKAALDTDQDGGALRIFGCDEVSLSHSTLFCNFSREHGGALSATGSNIVIRNCNVSNNQTYTGIDTVYAMYGGGMCFLKCHVDIVGTNFCYNNGHNAIGGALSLDSCAVNIDRCKFEHNYGINGAGLYLIRSNDWPCCIANSLFANNTSGHFGGGLAISDSSPEMSNLTVVNNHSIGVNCGGIFFYQYSSPTIRNCIVYGNTNEVPLEEPVQMWSWTYEDQGPKFLNCLVQYGLRNISGNEAVQVYENCLDENPMFADAENDDFRLNSSSPCINSGYTRLPDLEAFDLDQNPRVKGGIIDMGAYEFSGEGVNEESQNESVIHIISNPVTATSYAEIESGSQERFRLSVYSMDGRLLCSKDLGTFQTGLQRIEIGAIFEDLARGTYLLVLKGSSQTLTAKVVKP